MHLFIYFNTFCSRSDFEQVKIILFLIHCKLHLNGGQKKKTSCHLTMKERKDTVERIALQAHEKSEWSDTTEIKLTSAHFIFLTTEITV